MHSFFEPFSDSPALWLVSALFCLSAGISIYCLFKMAKDPSTRPVGTTESMIMSALFLFLGIILHDSEGDRIKHIKARARKEAMAPRTYTTDVSWVESTLVVQFHNGIKDSIKIATVDFIRNNPPIITLENGNLSYRRADTIRSEPHYIHQPMVGIGSYVMRYKVISEIAKRKTLTYTR